MKEFAGPWYCELCEDLSLGNSGQPSLNSWEKPNFVAECGICGGANGAYRKSSDGHWIHAFCAEVICAFIFWGQFCHFQCLTILKCGILICSYVLVGF